MDVLGRSGMNRALKQTSGLTNTFSVGNFTDASKQPEEEMTYS